jgi:hypothetical protein
MSTTQRRWLAGLSLAAVLAASVANADTSAPYTPARDRRREEQTFLTFPEWYLVHSPAELAAYLAADRPSSAFPYFGHIGQFWQGYGNVAYATRTYPINGGYHLMVSVIGVSTTVEYSLKALYEGTVGLLSEATVEHGPTAPDQLAATVAQDYVDFIRVQPWYEYNFSARLKQLWTATPWSGDDLLRQVERHFALSTEYGAKALYGGLIKLATQSVYDPALPTTAVVIDRWPSAEVALPDLRRIGKAGSGVLATVPRYEGFKTYAAALAAKGVNFQEVAGNHGPLLVSLIAPLDAPPPSAPSRLLFTQPMLTQPGTERRVLTVPVAELSAALRDWATQRGVLVEHLYDY